MDAWVWIVLIIAVLVVAGIVWFITSRSRQEAARQAKAQAHRDEADLRAARAQQEQAAAEEQAARARRERAEIEERSALAEREARDRLNAAETERARADALYRRADELAPGSQELHTERSATGDTTENVDGSVTPATTRAPDVPPTRPTAT